MRKRLLELSLIFMVIAVGLQSQATAPHLPDPERVYSVHGLRAGMSTHEAEAEIGEKHWALKYNEPSEFCLLTPLNPAEEMWFANDSMVLFREKVVQTVYGEQLEIGGEIFHDFESVRQRLGPPHSTVRFPTFSLHRYHDLEIAVRDMHCQFFIGRTILPRFREFGLYQGSDYVYDAPLYQEDRFDPAEGIAL